MNTTMNSLSIREVPHDTPEYWATVALRDAVLRKPLGLRFEPAELLAESDSRHIACYRGDNVVGCLVLRPGTGGDLRMRQVAVATEVQRKGIGRAMVEFSETLARRLGFARMVLHARQIAVPFYERLGYWRIGDCFEEVTIPHWEMVKELGSSFAQGERP
jgi:ribosomal protein S18 acetylase RimI-like enzyme